MNLKECAEFIGRWEGFRSKVYLCSAGVPTFGYGSLVRNYPNQKFPISKEDALALLMDDIETIYYPAVKRLITIPLKNNQEIALTSFCYNLGVGALQRSTLRKRVNLGEFDAVPREFMKWCKAAGIKIPGLVKRRQAEADLFIS